MVEAGAPAPAFRLEALGGGTESLADLLKKGRALVALLKVSCPFCQLASPFLDRIAAGAGLQVIAVSQDDDGSTQNFNQRFGVTFPTLLDRAKEDYPASNAYGISSVPSIFMVEPDGR